MSLDSIVNITISTQNLSMAQAGFGTPMVIAPHEYLKNRVTNIEISPNYSPCAMLKKRRRCLRLNNSTKALCIAPLDARKDIAELAQIIGKRRLLAGIDLDDNTLDLAAVLKESDGARRIFAMYKEDANDFPAAAWMGRMLAQIPGSASWAFKELVGIKKSKLSSDKIAKLKEARVNRHIDINKVGVTMDGKVMNDEYIDIIHGIDWLHVRMQERLFRLLMINEKIPYTLKGIDLVRSEILAQLKDAVHRGLLAAEPEPYVSTPDIDDIDPLVRSQRKLPDVLFGGRLAGAIHEIEIRGTVTT